MDNLMNARQFKDLHCKTEVFRVFFYSKIPDMMDFYSYKYTPSICVGTGLTFSSCKE